MDEYILKILQSCKLFQSSSANYLRALLSEIEIKNYLPGSMIVNEGDTGDFLCVVIEGSVQVYTYNHNAELIVLSRLEKNDYFGEQVLLGNIPKRRNASVRALTPVTLLIINRASFKRYLHQNPSDLVKKLLKQGDKQIIEKVTKQLVTGHDQKDIGILLKKIKTFKKRQVFFRQGDQPEHAYFILSGMVDIYIFDEKNNLKNITHVHPSQFFGEKSILQSGIRAGTAVARGKTKVSVISKEALQYLHHNNLHFKETITKLFKVFDINSIGTVTQYRGTFLDRPAIYNRTSKFNGETIISALVISENIFATKYLDTTIDKQILYGDEFKKRELDLENNKLVGVTNIGEWDDLKEIFHLLQKKIEITPEMLVLFNKTGSLAYEDIDELEATDIICECMRVKKCTILKLIKEGITKIDDIANITAAGTVCGGCRPTIIELLGGNAWNIVEITHIEDQSDFIKSFRFTPLDKSKCMDYPPGKFIVIEVNINNQWIRRSYTLTSISQYDYYEVTIKKENNGLLSSWLFNHAKIGMHIKISDPQGAFNLKSNNESATIFFMAGIGITPAIAYMRNAIKEGHQNLIYLDYSIHDLKDCVFKNEINGISNTYENIKLNLRETSKQGRLKEEDIKLILQQYPKNNIYICGPLEYQKLVISHLKRHGVNDTNIHIEEFYSASEKIKEIPNG